MRILLIAILVLSSTCLNAQIKKHKKKHSTSKGTFTFFWGYNRAWYTKSTIRFVGSDYDFKLKGAKASDRPDRFRSNPGLYFNPTTITIPQYNDRIGYYYTDRWQISFGVDHMKYVFNDQNEVKLNGFIASGVDSTWSGNYFDEPVVTDVKKFHYENTNGVNLLRFELTRSFDLYEIGRKRQLAITGNLGLGVGPVLTFNDLNFANRHTIATPSLSGFSLSTHIAGRIEFFKHFFIQAEASYGAVALTHVRTRPDDRNQYARQNFGFSQYFMAFGGIIYFSPKNGCDSCPHW